MILKMALLTLLDCSKLLITYRIKSSISDSLHSPFPFQHTCQPCCRFLYFNQPVLLILNHVACIPVFIFFSPIISVIGIFSFLSIHLRSNHAPRLSSCPHFSSGVSQMVCFLLRIFFNHCFFTHSVFILQECMYTYIYIHIFKWETKFINLTVQKLLNSTRKEKTKIINLLNLWAYKS